MEARKLLMIDQARFHRYGHRDRTAEVRALRIRSRKNLFEVISRRREL